MEQQHHASEPRSRKRTMKPEAAATPAVIHPAPLPQAPIVAAPGWHDLAEETYHSDPYPAPSLSSHMAMTVISKSLMHAWRSHPRSPGSEPSVMGAAADRGSAAHALLFGGKAIEAIVADDFRTTAARHARDKARASGRIPMLSKDIEGLAGMIEPARQRFHDLHGGAFLCEQTAIWRDASTLITTYSRSLRANGSSTNVRRSKSTIMLSLNSGACSAAPETQACRYRVSSGQGRRGEADVTAILRRARSQTCLRKLEASLSYAQPRAN